MSAEVLVFFAIVAGFVGGVSGASLLLRFADTNVVGWLLCARRRPWSTTSYSIIDFDIDEETLTEADRQSVAHEFAAHVDAMQRQVTDYADLLAGSDPVLRARLRQFERGGEGQ